MIVLKTIAMMLGELDYDRTYLETSDEQHFSNTSLTMLLLFAIMMPILLMNLLVGLAIGDLMQIQQNARLKRLAMQVILSRKNLSSEHIYILITGTISYKS
jgi:transient receptor potential cation channel subfamily A protein 1